MGYAKPPRKTNIGGKNMNKEYRALTVNSTDSNIKSIIKNLNDAGIDKSSYRINYFNINAEIVADKKTYNKIKNILK